MRHAGNSQDVAYTVRVDVIAGRYLFQRGLNIRRAGLVPDGPDGRIFCAERPQSISLYAHLPRSTHFVHRCDRVQ